LLGIYTIKWVPVPFSIPNESFSFDLVTDKTIRIKRAAIIYPLILATVLHE